MSLLSLISQAVSLITNFRATIANLVNALHQKDDRINDLVAENLLLKAELSKEEVDEAALKKQVAIIEDERDVLKKELDELNSRADELASAISGHCGPPVTYPGC